MMQNLEDPIENALTGSVCDLSPLPSAFLKNE